MKYVFFFLALALASCARVSGVVVDRNGAPLPGAMVSADCAKGINKTTASGRFSFRAKCGTFAKASTVRVTYGTLTKVLPNAKFNKPVEVVFDVTLGTDPLRLMPKE